jgi:protease I
MLRGQQRAAFARTRVLFVTLIQGLIFSAGLAGYATTVAAADEFPAIRAAVFDYFEGINTVSRDRLERAFDPGAELKSVGESGALVVEPIADAIERWMRGEPDKRVGDILSIDIAAGEIARVVFDYDGRYVDFLTLARINGQWKIIDKVFIRR